jgi:protein tyrosine phosphatase
LHALSLSLSPYLPPSLFLSLPPSLSLSLPLSLTLQEQCSQYWPTEQRVIRQYENIFVELTQLTECGAYTKRQFSITNTRTNEKRTVLQFQYLDWPDRRSPSDTAAVLELIEVLRKSQDESGGPVIAHDW